MQILNGDQINFQLCDATDKDATSKKISQVLQLCLKEKKILKIASEKI